MRYLNFLIAAIFALAAALQYNDPDPWLWSTIYLYAAVNALMASFQRFYMPAVLSLGVICIVWMATLTGDVADFLREGEPALIVSGMSADRPHVELAREFGGLGLVLASSIFYGVLARRPGAANQD